MQTEGFNAARVLGLIAVLGLAVGCLLVLRPFLSALLWAAILVYSTWPAYRVLRDACGVARLGGRGDGAGGIPADRPAAGLRHPDPAGGYRGAAELGRGLPDPGHAGARHLARRPAAGRRLYRPASLRPGFRLFRPCRPAQPLCREPGAECAGGAAGGAFGSGRGAGGDLPGLLPLPGRPGDRQAGGGGAGAAGRRPDPAPGGADRGRDPRRGSTACSAPRWCRGS